MQRGWIRQSSWLPPENPRRLKNYSTAVKLVNPKGNQHWIFIGKTIVEASILTTWSQEPTHWKTLVLGKIDGRRGWQRITWLDGIIDSMDISLSKLQEIVKDREAWRAVFMGSQSQTWLSDWIAATTAMVQVALEVRLAGKLCIKHLDAQSPLLTRQLWVDGLCRGGRWGAETQSLLDMGWFTENSLSKLRPTNVRIFKELHFS